MYNPTYMAQLLAMAITQATQLLPNTNQQSPNQANPDLDAIATNSHLLALLGIAQSNLLSWCGVMETSALPQIWALFRSADLDTTWLTILDWFLQAEQVGNYHVNYTLCPEVIQDISKLKFWYLTHLDLIGWGITPFTIQKMSLQQEADLAMFEDAATWATQVAMADILDQTWQSKRVLVPDPNMFMETLATFTALVKILFGPTSPLYKDVDELYWACWAGNWEHMQNTI